METKIDVAVERHGPLLTELALALHAQPELQWQEHEAVRRIGELLAAQGVAVEPQLGGLATAFRARTGSGSGARVAILAEYDALPEVGHACGHNLIAAAAVGAFLALADLGTELPGSAELIGTPAEEGGGGKIRLIEARVFDGVDGAMVFHPFDRDVVMLPTLASARLALTFRGRPAHAAASPHLGASALTACLDTFRLVDGQRVHFKDGVRVHGVVVDGGEAVNIIPERAQADFSVRARSQDELARVQAIVERCARGAATASDVAVEIEPQQGYRDMRNNEPLAERFAEHLGGLGRPALMTDPTAGTASTDMGDVSHELPAIHPWLAICDRDETALHERRFAEHAASERGLATMLIAAKAMARTAADLLTQPELLARARERFAG